MLSPPVPIPIASYLLAYHLKSQDLAYHLKSRDASPAPSALRAERARNRQISNGRLYLPLLYFRCDSFRVFTNARHRAHEVATCRCDMLSYFLMSNLTRHPGRGPGISLENGESVYGANFTVILNLFQDPPESDLRKSPRATI